MNNPINYIAPLAGILKLDQIAFLSRSDEDTANIKRMLRLSQAEWVHDDVVAEGFVFGQPEECVNHAHLEFCYAYGIEVEILRYTKGANYPDIDGRYMTSRRPVHFGFHVDKGKKLPEAFEHSTFPTNILQRVRTLSHTNEFLLRTGRKYQYTIYDTVPLFGVHLKVIERIPGENE